MLIPLPELQTKRLCLRPFQESDKSQVASLANHPEVVRDLRTFDVPYTENDAQQWLETLGPKWEQGLAAVFAICLKQQDASPDQDARPIVGATGLIIDPQSQRAECGYWIGKDFWGNGICSEALPAILDFGFNQLGLNKITAECLTRNVASIAVLTKSGFSQEGHFHRHFRKRIDEEFHDILAWGLLREDWNKRS